MEIEGDYSVVAATDAKSFAGKQPGLHNQGFFPVFIVIAYLNQGVAQHFCLIAQPLDFFLLETQGFNAAQVAGFLAVLMTPWLIKPIYGVASDFIPIKGQHLKPYLLIGTALGALSYFAVAINPPIALLLPFLVTASFGMALSTVVLVALVAKLAHGNSRQVRSYFALQATAYYFALIVCGVVGGLLCQKLSATAALQTASLICAFSCLIACFAILKHSEERSRNKPSFSRYRKLIVSTVASRRFQVVAMIVFIWNLSPSFTTPLYFYYIRNLHFEQDLVGKLLAINSFGMLCGTFVFNLLMRFISSPRKQAVIAVSAGVVTNLLYLFCVDAITAISLDFVRGISQMLAILTIYGLVADVCPRKIAATGTGVLIAINNAGLQLGTLLGANLFTFFCHGSIQPFAVMAAAAATLPLFFVRSLPRRCL